MPVAVVETVKPTTLTNEASRLRDFEVIDTPELNSFDLCDLCGAASYLRVVKRDGSSDTLTFCGNHGKRVLPQLRAANIWLFDDQTDRLFESNLEIDDED